MLLITLRRGGVQYIENIKHRGKKYNITPFIIDLSNVNIQ